MAVFSRIAGRAFVGAFFIAAACGVASAQSLPGADFLGKAQAAGAAAKALGGDSALSKTARDMAVKEATGSIKQKAGDYAKQKALETATKNPKLAGKALGAAGKYKDVLKYKDAAKKAGDLKSLASKDGLSQAKGMAADKAKSKLRDTAVDKLKSL